MQNPQSSDEPEVHLGPLAMDVFFMSRNLHAALRPAVQAMRIAVGVEDSVIGVLSLIMLNPGISQNQLASSLVLKKSAVTKVVKALEAEGLVERQRDKSDRRKNELTLTPEGKRRVVEIRDASQAMQDRLFAGIPHSERHSFFRVMERVLTATIARSPIVDEDDVVNAP